MDKYNRILESHGIKPNINRIFVYRHLCETEKAFSLCSLTEALGGQMDRTTVYRTLILLTEKKLIQKIPSSDGSTLFAIKSYDTLKSVHTNFRCKCCQKIENLPNLPHEYLKELADQKINLEAVTIEGYCKDCS